MTEEREKNAYNEYLVMPRLKKLFELLGEAGVDGYLTMGPDENLGINATLSSGEVFISYRANNVNYADLLKVRYDSCDMVLSLRCASDTVIDGLQELLVPEELVKDADDITALTAAYESGLWLGSGKCVYDGGRLKEIIPLLEERDLVLTDKSSDGKKPHVLIESVDRMIELSVVHDDEDRPLILMRAPKEAGSDSAVCTVFPDNGDLKDGALYEREIGIFERYIHVW